MTVNSTKELIELFPELPRTNKFKRKIDELFNHGYSFDIRIASPWMCFTAKSGKNYKAKISYNGNSYFIKKTKVVNTAISMNKYNENPELYHDISEKPVGRSKFGNEDWVDSYTCTREDTDRIEWSTICYFMGKLLKDKIVHVEKCGKCGGSGFIPQFAYYANGVCFDCMGIGSWFEVTNK